MGFATCRRWCGRTRTRGGKPGFCALFAQKLGFPGGVKVKNGWISSGWEMVPCLLWSQAVQCGSQGAGRLCRIRDRNSPAHRGEPAPPREGGPGSRRLFRRIRWPPASSPGSQRSLSQLTRSSRRCSRVRIARQRGESQASSSRISSSRSTTIRGALLGVPSEPMRVSSSSLQAAVEHDRCKKAAYATGGHRRTSPTFERRRPTSAWIDGGSEGAPRVAGGRRAARSATHAEGVFESAPC